MDAKALLGAYVSSDTPGEFRWQPGPLSLAVERGLWVLIEDLDRAPLEVRITLVDRSLYCTDAGRLTYHICA